MSTATRFRTVGPAPTSAGRAPRSTLLLALLAWAVGLAQAPAAGAQIEAEFADEFDARSAPAQPAEPAQPAPAAQATPAPAPEPSRQTEVRIVERSEHVQSSDAPAEPLPPEDLRARRMRTSNTWDGPSGGIRVVDAGSGQPGTFRLQLGVELFSSTDYLIEGDTNDYVGGTLSLSWTLNDFLELFLSVDNHANENTMELPTLLQVLGDTRLGLKAFAEATPWLTLGGDVRFVVLNAVGDIGPVFGGTSVGLRGNVSADLRNLQEPTPLILRAAVDYYFDNSSELIEDVEDQRYRALGDDRRDRLDEDRHLVRRVERFALGINRTDAFTPSVGVELPLRLADDIFLHPIAEWWIAVPVNRQDYSCLLLPTDAGPGDPDGCLEEHGVSAMPSTLTLAMRFFPPVSGLSFALGVDIGLSGTSTFVRELAPNAPWALLLGLAYAVDPAPPGAARVETREVIREVEKAPPPKPRIAGVVADRATGDAIGGAAVAYPGLGLTTQLTDSTGSFISYGMEPGQVVVNVSHPDYEPQRCAVLVPEAKEGAAGQGASASAAAPPAGPAPAPPPAEPVVTLQPSATPALASGDAPGTLVPLRCELNARPRRGEVRGSIINSKGQPVAGAAVQVRGSSSHDVVSDAGGRFLLSDVPAGNYTAQVDAEGYLLKLISFELAPGGTATPSVELVGKPKQAAVQLTKQEVRIRKQIYFMTSSAEIRERSFPLMSEIADVLLRNPHVLRVEIQGHTDDRGADDLNQNLSQLRAEAVRDWLINAGVARERLTAKGYGEDRPLVPNITDRNRAKNRRVQFMILEQDLKTD